MGTIKNSYYPTGIKKICFLRGYKKTKEIKVTYSCEVWDAPTGGKYCEKCNEGVLPCTEYQCKSLGQACELLNKGTAEEACTWVNPKDVEKAITKETILVTIMHVNNEIGTIQPIEEIGKIFKEIKAQFKAAESAFKVVCAQGGSSKNSGL